MFCFASFDCLPRGNEIAPGTQLPECRSTPEVGSSQLERRTRSTPTAFTSQFALKVRLAVLALTRYCAFFGNRKSLATAATHSSFLTDICRRHHSCVSRVKSMVRQPSPLTTTRVRLPVSVCRRWSTVAA
ncbi:hypothetical protein LSAT2_010107 [Lamellibrachia satsuma]|nr:hypothetical protein LSAT2_010107 [Lamellibrachia satsuma]